MTQMDYGFDGDMGAETYMQDLKTWAQAFWDDWNIKLCVSSVMTFFAELFGEDWWLIQCLFVLLLSDLCLGIFSALKFDGHLSGRRLHDGVVKFAAYAVSIILVWLVQEICRRTVPVDIPVMGIYAGYQSLTEIKSIARHFERLGITMPKLFHRVTNGVGDSIDKKLDEKLPEAENKEQK